ncbi:hypothetical protein [uncultured Winogradskyella sp.]|uniref:hypothetical protein n=1 Tax=uncultured Winogradskyella sp. TaxID=395353 RepID=UPI00262AB781|nr:hypothetical protein [uncultured Winogradskyella sp.]
MYRLLFLIFCFCSLQSFSQEAFLVLEVKGTITYDSINKPIAANDEFFGNPKFKFASNEASAVILSTTQGRVILFANQPEPKATRSALVYYLQTNILPEKKYNATRGGDVATINVYFKGNSLYQNKTIGVMSRAQKTGDFYLSYLKNDNIYLTKLTREERLIHITAETFTQPDNDKTYPIKTINLHYQDKDTKEFTTINSFTFQIYNIEHIQGTIKHYKSWLSGHNTPAKEQIAFCEDYLLQNFGSDLDLKDLGFD